MSIDGLSNRVAMLLGPEQIEIVDQPVAPIGADEALIAIRAATTCGTDVKVFKRGGHPRMLVAPTPFGHEFAGEVVAVGSKVRKLREGERVVVANSAPCAECRFCQRERENLCENLEYLNGAFARYIKLPARFVQRSVYRIPDSLDFATAALTEPLACVVHGFNALDLKHDETAVVFGGGPIGLLFVALLARRGHPTLLVDPNPSRLDTAKLMGARWTLLAQRDASQAAAVHEIINGGAHCAIDCTGSPQAWSDAIRSVAVGGTVNLFGGCAPGTEVALDTHLVHYSEITIKGVYHHKPNTFAEALQLLSDAEFPASHLLGGRRPVDEVELALRAMIDKQALKVVVTG